MCQRAARGINAARFEDTHPMSDSHEGRTLIECVAEGISDLLSQADLGPLEALEAIDAALVRRFDQGLNRLAQAEQLRLLRNLDKNVTELHAQVMEKREYIDRFVDTLIDAERRARE
jgi:hypothetical protein